MATEVEGHVDDNDSRRLENRLVPPIGTMFFGIERFTVADRVLMCFTTNSANNGSVNPDRFDYTLTWDVTMYKYAVNGDPTSPNFVSNNGEIYVIMVHRGAIECRDTIPGMRFRFSIGPRPVGGNSRPVIPLTQLPRTGSGTRDDKSMNYDINYSQTFDMLNNNGNSQIAFDARYFESFNRIETIQTGRVPATTVEFGIEADTAAEVTTIPPYKVHPIHGLSIFTNQQPATWPVTFNFVHDSWSPSPGGWVPPRAEALRLVALDF
ncbi:hypothetical protein HGRIS_013520 [Hohenbuehelia grisea]|uniref:Uncharacterized protein n=1 Tax=Hohenbuehelia grisea TaxID=104357 RepID=A0ABR3IVS8_9AGAR